MADLLMTTWDGAGTTPPLEGQHAQSEVSSSLVVLDEQLDRPGHVAGSTDQRSNSMVSPTATATAPRSSSLVRKWFTTVWRAVPASAAIARRVTSS